MITQIEVDTTYRGHDGTLRYVDDFDGVEVDYYRMDEGAPPGPHHCTAKRFLKWAKEEVLEENASAFDGFACDTCPVCDKQTMVVFIETDSYHCFTCKFSGVGPFPKDLTEFKNAWNNASE